MQRLEVSCAVRRIYTSLGAIGLKIILMVFSLLHLGLSIGLLSLSPNQNPVGVSLLPHTCHVSRPFFRHVIRNNKCFYFPLSRASEVTKFTEREASGLCQYMD